MRPATARARSSAARALLLLLILEADGNMRSARQFLTPGLQRDSQLNAYLLSALGWSLRGAPHAPDLNSSRQAVGARYDVEHYNLIRDAATAREGVVVLPHGLMGKQNKVAAYRR